LRRYSNRIQDAPRTLLVAGSIQIRAAKTKPAHSMRGRCETSVFGQKKSARIL
jgi:hypothetical protein